jgi:hypothetical protein
MHCALGSYIFLNLELIMSYQNGGQTGPKSLEGKRTAAKNALKTGAYSNVLMPNENPQDLEDMATALVEQYGINCTVGHVKAQRAAMTLLQIKRVESFAAVKSVSALESIQARKTFCERVAIREEMAQFLPRWYFEDEDYERSEARFYFAVSREAQDLKDRHTPSLMQTVKTEFKHLWSYLMGTNGAIEKQMGFGERLVTVYKKSKPEFNLQALIDQVENQFKYELLWAENERWYEAVLAEMKAEAALSVATDEKLAKCLSRLNKQLDSELLWLEQIREKRMQTLVIDNPDLVNQVLQSALIEQNDVRQHRGIQDNSLGGNDSDDDSDCAAA